MRAVSPGRAAVQDMDTDHGRLYVAMAEGLLDRADTVAPSSVRIPEHPVTRSDNIRSAIPEYPVTLR